MSCIEYLLLLACCAVSVLSCWLLANCKIQLHRGLHHQCTVWQVERCNLNVQPARLHIAELRLSARLSCQAHFYGHWRLQAECKTWLCLQQNILFSR